MSIPSSLVISINASNNGITQLIIQLIKDENKIRWNQTDKRIIDPILDLMFSH